MTSRENDDGVGMAMTTARRAEAKDSVRVCVRIRPLSTKEQQGQMKPCIRIASSMDGLTVNKADQQVDGPQQMIVGKDRAFTFDHILGINCTQEVH
jgi:citrate lyase beta subunit